MWREQFIIITIFSFLHVRVENRAKRRRRSNFICTCNRNVLVSRRFSQIPDKCSTSKAIFEAVEVSMAMGMAGVVAVALCTFFIPRPLLVGADTALDFCVGDLQAPSSPSGYACKMTDLVTADDFAYSGLRNPGKTNNFTKTAIAPAFATEFPALNGLGLSLARVDIEPGGVVLTHTHPRSSELALIVQGRVLVGFISTSNVPYSKTLEEGDIMAIPRGVLHYLINVGETSAIAYATFSSPTPGLQWTSYALFSNDLPADVVSKCTFISDPEVKRLKDLLANESRNKRLFSEINEKDQAVNA